jgi:hypothetical protein
LQKGLTSLFADCRLGVIAENVVPGTSFAHHHLGAVLLKRIWL